jgi:hypothetical protein
MFRDIVLFLAFWLMFRLKTQPTYITTDREFYA